MLPTRPCCRVGGFAAPRAVFTVAMHRDGASSGKLSYGGWSSSPRRQIPAWLRAPRCSAAWRGRMGRNRPAECSTSLSTGCREALYVPTYAGALFLSPPLCRYLLSSILCILESMQTFIASTNVPEAYIRSAKSPRVPQVASARSRSMRHKRTHAAVHLP